MEKIYRIISFPRFVELITRRAEALVSPTSWEDTYEGVFFNVQKNPEKCEVLLRALCEKYCGDLNLTLSNFIKCLLFPYFSYAQCWSTEADSDALWRIYDHDKMSVQICTTDESWLNIIKNQLDNNKNHFDYILRLEPVLYDLEGDSNTIIEMLQSKALKDHDLCDMYFHKRPAFAHEKEKRLLFINKDLSNTYQYFINADMINNIQKACNGDLEKATLDIIVHYIKDSLKKEKSDKKFDTPIFVNLNDDEFKNYIKSVKLNPFAPKWVDELVNELCQKNNLNYKGKSELYSKI